MTQWFSGTHRNTTHTMLLKHQPLCPLRTFVVFAFSPQPEMAIKTLLISGISIMERPAIRSSDSHGIHIQITNRLNTSLELICHSNEFVTSSTTLLSKLLLQICFVGHFGQKHPLNAITIFVLCVSSTADISSIILAFYEGLSVYCCWPVNLTIKVSVINTTPCGRHVHRHRSTQCTRVNMVLYSFRKTGSCPTGQVKEVFCPM